MKKYLPKFVIVFLCLVVTVSNNKLVSAAAPQPTVEPSPNVGFSEDPEVNFVGKSDARAVQFLNWTLQNYEWACYVEGDPDTVPGVRKCDNDKNPLIKFWVTIRNIVYALFALIILATAFILMATRGRSLTLKRFIPRFIAVVLLVTLSYSLIQIIYTTVDIIQGFFLAKPPTTPGGQREFISSVDLLYVGWDYETFKGLRKVHPYFDESVFVNLLLARLTAVTYYAMTGILIIRKIILWFFIVLSPIFPILLLYYPVRNTAKIWIGEFFRWLLYAPLFTIFLSGLVSVWKSPRLPLIFDFSNVGSSFTYPTATNVLLGGPGQVVTYDNNLNTPDTFALYVVALIMLWVVILLPFILLQIFLDYLNNFSFDDSPAMQKLINTSYMLLNKAPPVPVTPLTPPSAAGMAKQIPFNKFGAAKSLPISDEGPIGAAKQIPIAVPAGTVIQSQMSKPVSMAQAYVNAEILNATNISLPTIRDIASFERQIISNRESTNISKTHEALRGLANPANIQNEIERDRFTKLKERLVKESQTGNNVATSILSAANIVNNTSNVSQITTQNNKQVKNLRKSLTNISNPQSASSIDKERITQLHDSLIKESEQGSTLATTILSAKENITVRELQNIKDQLTKESVMGNNTSTAVLATSFTKEHESVLKNVLTQIANPAAASSFDREKITQLHDSLVKESEKGNTLATSILSTKETATSNEIHDMKEKLIEATLQGNQNAASILSTAITRIDSVSTQKVMQQLANPGTITNVVTKEKFEKVKEKLTQAQQQGNQFATSMLSKMDAVSKEETNLATPVNTKEMETIKAQLLDAKEKGEPLATDMLNLFTTEGSIAEGVSVPGSNRIQTVSVEDYQAVRKMWEDNYKGMDVPDDATNRMEWVKDEVKDIDNILSLLESNDNERVNEGMQQVGNVLPFLMLGGFSQSEIISYLKAKQEAGKTVIEEITNEEETLVSAPKHTVTHAAMTRAASIDDSSELEPVINTVSDSSPKLNVSSELLDLTNLPIPTISDIVRYEMSISSKDPDKQADVIKMRDTLNQIADPSLVNSEEDRVRLENVRNILVQNSSQGDQLATSIINAANHIAITSNSNPIQLITTNQVLKQLAHPESITQESTKLKMSALHDRVKEESEKGNELARSLLSINDTSTTEDVQKIKELVIAACQNQDPLGVEVFDLLPKDEPNQTVTLPQDNKIQTISLEDYENVRKLWEEYYREMDVPGDFANREEWIKADIDSASRVLESLSQSDAEKVEQGMREAGRILPFLLLGGFSQAEIVTYHKAKIEAGKSVLSYLDSAKNEEESLVNVNIRPEASADKAQAINIETIADTDTTQSPDSNIANETATETKES